jgi:1,2-diacylglycerol 3-beta-galactosyltransferase
MMSHKVLILMSDTGGGHRAAAEAITEAMTYRFGSQVVMRTVDLWKNHSPWPVNQIGDMYPWLSSDGQWLWELLWRSDTKLVSPKRMTRVFTPLVRRTVSRMFVDEAPDLVLSVHPLLNHIPLQLLRRELQSDVPFVTVVTDMVTAHWTWFCPGVDYCMVPTESARQRGLHYGMSPDRVEVVGQPVSLRFAARLGEKRVLRRRLGLDLDRPAVLVVGGGEGVGPVYQIARAVARRVPNAQLIVVSGRNASLRQKLETAEWEIPTRIYGFVTNMPDLMSVSDVLVTKAGPGTLSEAFIAGLPVVISGFIPGQEEGNVDYVLAHDAGAYVSEPERIAVLLSEWLGHDGSRLAVMARNASSLSRPEAALTIAERLYSVVTETQISRPIPSWPGRSLSRPVFRGSVLADVRSAILSRRLLRRWPH